MYISSDAHELFWVSDFWCHQRLSQIFWYYAPYSPVFMLCHAWLKKSRRISFSFFHYISMPSSPVFKPKRYFFLIPMLWQKWLQSRYSRIGDQLLNFLCRCWITFSTACLFTLNANCIQNRSSTVWSGVCKQFQSPIESTGNAKYTNNKINQKHDDKQLSQMPNLLWYCHSHCHQLSMW